MLSEGRQFKKEAVKLWLEKLTDACYETDDVLDEWNTAMVKLAIQKQAEEDADKATPPPLRKKKVCSFISSSSSSFCQVAKLWLRNDIAHNIIELDENLMKLWERCMDLSWEEVLTLRIDQWLCF